jgi:hypothetical protein
MKRWSLFWMLLVLLPLNADAAKYALLVGIDAYPAPNTLNGCVNDVNRIRSLLVEHFGFPQENIKTVLDSAATLKGIEAAFRTHLIQQAQPGDIVVFYYSGHGTSTPDRNGDEADGVDETLCPVEIDGTKPETWLTDDILGSWLRQLRTEKVTVILDACHSGTGTRADDSDLVLKTIDLGFKFPNRDPKKENVLDPGMKHVLIAANAPDQSSYMSRQQAGSVLTIFLAEALAQASKDLTFERLMEQVVPKVQQYVRNNFPSESQTPQLEGNYAQPVFFMTAAATAPATATTTPPAAAPEAPSDTAERTDFPLTLTTNQPQYSENDLMTVTVQAARDCYLRLYVINAEQQVQQLFPNKWQPDNFIKAGQPVQIPGPGAKFRLRMSKPFGVETLKAVASTEQFSDLKNLDWQGKTFLDFGAMKLAEIDKRGIALEAVPTQPEISQATVMYKVQPR